MTQENFDRRSAESARPELKDDTGGLHAPPELHGLDKAWWWFHFVILVNLARLRFISILLAIGVVIMKWDTLTAYYEKWTRPAGAPEIAASDVEYFCPMHPSIVRDHPDKCPICFMPLSKRTKGSAHAEALPAGVVNRVQLSPYRVVLAGVQTFPVEYKPLTKDITAVGFIEFNERGQRTVSARVAGRIDRLIANETGQMVNAGDELASLYSPDLLVTVQNLVDAKRSGNESLLRDARSRLELLGIDNQQIDDIVASGKANTHLKIRSPIGGHVIKKYVREGQYVQEGMPLYDLADLSTVWIQAQIYEDDIPFLPVAQNESAPLDGLEVTASTRAFPNEIFRGKLTFIYPHVDEQTRTITVRFELQNPEHKLRPGSTATVTLKVKPQELQSLVTSSVSDEQKQMLKQGRVLALPDSSIIDTGKQKIAYREASPGIYEGVEVNVGPRMSSLDGVVFYPVLRGVNQGDFVVTSGSFLVDAETRLNPAIGSVYFGGSAQNKQAAATPVRPSTPEDPDAKVKSALGKLSPDDRNLAIAQRFCPILPANRLGSMGTPMKVIIDGRTVFLCCPGCKDKALANPKRTLETVATLNKDSHAATKPQPTMAQDQARKLYNLIGTVTEIANNKKSVTIDHEAIPSLMPAMKMPYKIENPKLLDGFNVGDRVQGRLDVRESDYVITELHKR